jgi:cytochrome c biogenesis protein CcmG, thiol:disulfide interchange protein DsbE
MVRGLRRQNHIAARSARRRTRPAPAHTLRHRAGCLALLIVSACGSSSSKPPPGAPSPLFAKATPDFARPAIDGSRVETASLRGRVMLIDFFAEHCVPCVKSLPAIEALHQARPNVAVVGVSEDDDVDGARRMVARNGLTFPVVHDPEHALAGRYRVLELPATFVVDARGVVRWHGAVEDAGELGAVVDAAR